MRDRNASCGSPRAHTDLCDPMRHGMAETTIRNVLHAPRKEPSNDGTDPARISIREPYDE
jgi:hypothetical protein